MCVFWRRKACSRCVHCIVEFVRIKSWNVQVSVIVCLQNVWAQQPEIMEDAMVLLSCMLLAVRYQHFYLVRTVLALIDWDTYTYNIINSVVKYVNERIEWLERESFHFEMHRICTYLSILHHSIDKKKCWNGMHFVRINMYYLWWLTSVW